MEYIEDEEKKSKVKNNSTMMSHRNDKKNTILDKKIMQLE